MGDASFPGARRLTKTHEYRVLYRDGRRVPSQHFLLFVRPSTVISAISRIGLSAGKKVGAAVVRNRVKRRMREIVRRCHSCFKFSADVILVAHPSSAGLSYVEMETEIRQLLSRAGLL